MKSDPSNGYDNVANTFNQVRSRTSGVSTIRSWAAQFKAGDTVLDIGSGPGLPLTKILIDLDLSVFAIDASPKMVSIFRDNFPHINIACETAEESTFFRREFDGILAVGLVFLLTADTQHQLIPRLADTLRPGGHLLFSAPKEQGSWDDLLTKRPSYSLGEDRYHRILKNSGLVVGHGYIDEGGSHYYSSTKPVS